MPEFVHTRDINSLTAYEFESCCRRATHYAYLGDNKGLCRVLNKYRIFIDTTDTGVAPHLITDGFWETWLTRCLVGIIKPGDTCIDIGANFGYYSILMSALAADENSTGRTIAVEPNPAICRLLRLTAAVNDPGFGVAEVALSNTAGKMPLHIPEGSFGDASLLKRTDRPWQKTTRVKVETISLDALLKRMNVEKVDVIKVDVEGAEPLVFEGMRETIAGNPGLKMLIEYSPFLYTDARIFTENLFSVFQVHRFKDVDQFELLEESSIEDLLQLKSHTDLYLIRK